MSRPAPTPIVQQASNHPLDLPSPALASTPQLARDIVPLPPTPLPQFSSPPPKTTLHTPIYNSNTTQSTSSPSGSHTSIDTPPVIRIYCNDTDPSSPLLDPSDQPTIDKMDPPDAMDPSESATPPHSLSFYGLTDTPRAEPVQVPSSGNDLPNATSSRAKSLHACRDSSADSACSDDERQARKLGRAIGRVIHPDTHASKRVKDCAGTDPDKTLNWVREISRQPDGCMSVAQQTATGPLLDFIARLRAQKLGPAQACYYTGVCQPKL